MKLITWIGQVLKSLAQVFNLASFKSRLETVEARFDTDYIKLDKRLDQRNDDLDKRLDQRNADLNDDLRSLAERIAHLEGRNKESDIERCLCGMDQ